MNPDARTELVVCGVCLMGLSLLARHLEPTLGTAALLIAVAGGVLCVVWGAAPCRVGAIVTLAAVACVLALEAVKLWRTSVDAGANHRAAAILMTLSVPFCVGTLANVAKSGGRREQ